MLQSPPELEAHPVTDTAVTEANRPGGPLAWLLVLCGLVGFIAASTLLIEKIALLEDPSYVPSCSINPILSCGSVMSTPQAEAFGFPNPIVGVAGFAVVATIGMAQLAGAQFRPWFWLGLQAGTTAGMAFIHWLIFQSLYRIDALCPYCMVVWAVTIPLFWYTTLHNVRAGNLVVAPVLRRAFHRVDEYHGVVLTVWYLAIAGLIAERFWDYWSTLIA
jgi:uncharacterized membrane protein